MAVNRSSAGAQSDARVGSDDGDGGRVSTGVAGLDVVLGGGLLPQGFYLLQGDPGSGKTTIALQFARSCVARGESILYVSLSESRQDLERTVRSHGWSFDGIMLLDLSKEESEAADPNQQNTLFYPAEIELGQTIHAILDEIERVRPRCIVFDGLSELRMLAGDSFTYRRQVLALKNYFEARKITVLLLDDRTIRLGESQPETLVGGSILLERSLPGYGGARRRLCVTKVRGAGFRSGYHDYDIVEGAGVVVHPRLIATQTAAPERDVFVSGVPGLDKMMGGGLQTGTTTLLLGPAGVGKSTISMQYVASALLRGVPSAVYTFDEVLETLFERTEKLCFQGVREYVESGLLHARQVNPAELSPGGFASDVQRLVNEEGVRIVVIDSLNGYISAMPEERFLETNLHELFAYLNQRGIVTILVVAQHGFLGSDMRSIDVSYLADSVLLMRYFEAGGEILQALSVVKKRNGYHERTLRQLRITEEGLSVGEPLHSFRGIMTGVPEYLGSEPILMDEQNR
ncbi:MAG: AAA family ATPase [Cytophagales bacterium]|nr:AAA family ATPase [Armatimonadota bacterium]